MAQGTQKQHTFIQIIRTPGRGDRGRDRHRGVQALPSVIADARPIVLDHSDWHPLTAKFLCKDLDLLQVDFHGFGPINPDAWTAAVFFSRNYPTTPARGRLPVTPSEPSTKSLQANKVMNR